MAKLVYPDYSRSIVSLSSGILRHFGLKVGEYIDLGLDRRRKTGLVIIDGFGWKLFEKVKSRAKAEKITSVFPSTTSSAMVSIFSGLTPAEHGIIGYKTFIKSAGGIIKPLEFTYGSSHAREALSSMGRMDDIVRLETLASKLKRRGVRMSVVSPIDTAGSQFTTLLTGGEAKVYPYLTIWDAFDIFRRRMSSGRERLVCLYLPYIDSLAHRYSYDSDSIGEAINYMYSRLIGLSEELGKKAGIIATADHGHTKISERIDLMGDSRLMGKLDIPPYGDGRALFFRSRYDIHRELSRYNLKIFGREETFRLLGGGKPTGGVDYPDFSAVPLDGKTYDYTYSFTDRKERKRMVSGHGGLSADEMEVPLIRL